MPLFIYLAKLRCVQLAAINQCDTCPEESAVVCYALAKENVMNYMGIIYKAFIDLVKIILRIHSVPKSNFNRSPTPSRIW